MSIKNAAPSLLPSTEGFVQSLMGWQGAMGKSLTSCYFYQWELLAAWQRTLGEAQREYMDQWICRFGGGVPLDG